MSEEAEAEVVSGLQEHHIHFALLLVLVIFLKRKFGSSIFVEKKNFDSNEQITQRFFNFQRSYVFIFLTVMLADWMQGPYVYKLYSSYGYSQSEIATLFVVGFGTAGVFGTFIGGYADRFGRKMTCILFCVSYIISCLTKHVSTYSVLMVGRFLGGVSTAILFSAFEAWMVTHHHRYNFPGNLLSDTFRIAWGWNAIVAVLAGVITSVAVHFYSWVDFGGEAPVEVAAFDCSAIVLCVALFFISFWWEENYGDVTVDVKEGLKKSFTLLFKDYRIPLLGCVQSAFESAMYMFVFMWTPALEGVNQDGANVIDHGWIFANFMLACLVGSEIFGGLTRHWKMPIEQICIYVFAAAAFFMIVVVLVPNYRIRLLSFFGFELCCGVYFPAIGSLRGRYVPDEVRATVMNIFRVPLNLIVVGVLLYIDWFGQNVFSLNFVLLCVAAACVSVLYRSVPPPSHEFAKVPTDDIEAENIEEDNRAVL